MASLGIQKRLAGISSLSSLSQPSKVGVDVLAKIGFNILAGTSFALTLNDPGGLARAMADAGITPEAAFDMFSTARSAPAQTYYVNVTTGSDGKDGLSAANPKRTIGGAITAANVAGTPTKYIITGGDYARYDSPAAITPNHDCAFIGPSTGTRVNLGSYDAASNFTFALDATYTTLYSKTAGDYDLYTDRINLDEFGNAKDYVIYATPDLLRDATLAANASGKAYANGKIYLRRGDAQVPSYVNTRMFTTVQTWRFRNPLSVYMENIDSEGSGSAVDYAATGPAVGLKAFVAKNCTARYAGGKSLSAGRGFSLDSVPGLIYLYNCSGESVGTDGICLHHTSAPTAVKAQALLVNCNGRGNGKPGYASCQGLAVHEDHIVIDAGGCYQKCHGVTVNVGYTTKGYFLGTLAENDLGDIVLGGASQPVAFGIYGTAEWYADRMKLNQPAGQIALTVGDIGTPTPPTFHYRDLRISAGATQSINGPFLPY